MTISIRWATIDDVDAMNQLVAQVDQWHRERYPHIFREAHPPRQREMWAQWLADDLQAIALATREDDNPVGLIQLAIQQSPEIPLLQPRRYMMIDTIVVDASYRSQGVGKLLMHTAHDWARQQGVHEFQLSVYVQNEDAVRFYEQLGYQTLFQRMVFRDMDA